jgi:arsenate reductase-like glutaredoxin family protein
MSEPVVQIWGTRKCQETRKAERWWKERGKKVQSIDLGEKGLSPGELRSVAAKVGGAEAMIDRAGKRYQDKGLRAAAPTGPRVEQKLLEDPLLLLTPIVRRGREATVGFRPEVWETWHQKGPLT